MIPNTSARLRKAALPALVAALTMLSGPALAAPAVALASDVFVEHTGTTNRILEPASKLRRGDRIVTVMRWKRAGGGTFTLTNPVPSTIHFEGSADGTEQVSVDGGRTWGRLGMLTKANRIAVAEDVTHVRWHIATPAPQGRIAYSAIVR